MVLPLKDLANVRSSSAKRKKKRHQSDEAPLPKETSKARPADEGEIVAPSKSFIGRFFNTIFHIRSVLTELSPDGLAARGVPFTNALRMPRSVLVASIVINLAGLALPLVILQVYDRIIPNQALETFSLMMTGLGAVVLLEGFLRIGRSYVISWSATRFTKAITQDLISRFLYATKGSFVGISQAKTIEKLTNINRVADFYGGQSRLMFIDVPFAAIFMVMVALVGGWLVAVPLVVLLLFGFVTIQSSREYKRVLEQKEEHEARTYDFVAETIGGILTMKCQSAEPLLIRRFERLQARNAQLHYSIILEATRGQSIANLLGNGTMIAMVTFGSILAINGNITVGVLACCSLLSGRAVQPILRVASTWNEFQRARISVAEVSKLFELEDIPKDEAIELDPPTPEISANNVTINLEKVKKVIGNVSFKVEPGEVIALMGPDGSGKTTFVEAMCGMRKPNSGTLMLDGIPAYEFRRKYQAAIGTIDANTEPFSGTIYENLSLFGQGASAESVRWATGVIDLEKDIDKLPHGYDTPLGTGISETLSRPFINRLLIARVLAQKPVLWAMDEPQNLLDDNGKETLIHAIENLRGWMTLLYTTHSEELARCADRIFYLEDGRLEIYDNYDAMKAAIQSRDFDGLSIDDIATDFSSSQIQASSH